MRLGYLNFVAVLMHAQRPLPALKGGDATLWRALGDLPPSVIRLHRLLNRGDFIGFAPPTSTSLSEESARGFLDGPSILFEMRGVTEGVPVWYVSKYPAE
eukprot:gene40850-57068_t